MLRFKRLNERYWYIPMYNDFVLVEEEIEYSPRVLRLPSGYYKRPRVGFTYKVEGTTYHKTMVELLRQDWDVIWAGVFVRTNLNLPASLTSTSITYGNAFIISGEVIVENLENHEINELGENGLKYTLRWKTVFPKKRPLWLAVAMLDDGRTAIVGLDIGKIHASFDTTPQNVISLASPPADGSIIYASFYEQLKYTWSTSDWDILDLTTATIQNTTEPYSETGLTPTLPIIRNSFDN